MNVLEPLILHELPAIRQIIRDETWLEAERRGCCVLSDDRVVRDNVCLVVLRIGEQLRESSERAIAAGFPVKAAAAPWPAPARDLR